MPKYIHVMFCKIKTTAKNETQNRNKDLKYEYKTNVNILDDWLKNLFIAMVFVNTDKKKIV